MKIGQAIYKNTGSSDGAKASEAGAEGEKKEGEEKKE